MSSSTSLRLPPGTPFKLTTPVLSTTVDLPELPVDPLDVIRAVALSRGVLRVRGTRDRPLHLVTTSSDRALTHLGSREASESWSGDDLGVCWPTFGVIWVAPTTRLGDQLTPRTPRAMITTLAHEVAHLLSRGVHAEAWRRAFLVLLPLWLDRDPRPRASLTPDHDPWWHTGHAHTIVGRYSRNRRPPGAEADEVARHHAAACRAWELWRDRFVAGAMLTPERTPVRRET